MTKSGKRPFPVDSRISQLSPGPSACPQLRAHAYLTPRESVGTPHRSAVFPFVEPT